MFLVLFVTTGIGNGSTYRMIPSIFREAKLAAAKGAGEAGRLAAIKAAGSKAPPRSALSARSAPAAAI